MSKSPQNSRPSDSKEARRLRFRRWYAKHRETLNAKRRRQYREDREYRARVEEAKRRYERKQSALACVSSESFFSLPEVCQMAGVPPQTLLRLERLQAIPAAPRISDDENSPRRYTPRMAYDLYQAVRAGIVHGASTPSFDVEKIRNYYQPSGGPDDKRTKKSHTRSIGRRRRDRGRLVLLWAGKRDNPAGAGPPVYQKRAGRLGLR